MSNPIRDSVTIANYKALNYATSCEDCSHFDLESETCTIGYPAEPFLRRNQLRDLNESGEIAFCRAIEID